MGRIKETFERLQVQKEKGLIPFLTAGDPDLATSERLIHCLVENGADLIELGVPFSDPMADGPTIQEASQRALAGGTTLAGILDMVERVRVHTNVPIVLMGYFNPVFHFGIEKFAARAATAGVDGLLIVDLPFEETAELRVPLRRFGIDLIALVTPTSSGQRMLRLAEAGEGFLYYVSMTGVTGSRQIDPRAIEQKVKELKKVSPVPVAVGFGISSPADAANVGRFADAVVVGSALVKMVAACGREVDPVARVGPFVRSLKDALRTCA